MQTVDVIGERQGRQDHITRRPPLLRHDAVSVIVAVDDLGSIALVTAVDPATKAQTTEVRNLAVVMVIANEITLCTSYLFSMYD